ncbi:MAG: hypothetical protein PVF76_04740 [Syntrophobacterales bacterium]|jgi:hypothetical protein
MRKQPESQPACSPIQKKIEQAHSLHLTWGDSLKQDPNINALLRKLESDIENTKNIMLEIGLVAECKRCEEEEGGSCCGAGIENRYDVVDLLINLLLGISLPTLVRSDNSCTFLGKNGCTLTARHVLCVNYICDKLQKKLAHHELIRLQESAGEELETQFLLHEEIKKRLRASP